MITLRHGFSLIEVTIVVAILGLVVAIGAPIYGTFLAKNDLTLAGNALALDIYRAQTLSRDEARDDTWGVHIQSGSITLFKGASWATRTAAFDEVYTLQNTVTPSGTTDYLFSKQTGLPTAAGTTTLSSTTNSTINVVVNSKGMVEY